MPPSEIDDIFAAKPKGKAEAIASTSSTLPAVPSKKTSKKKHKDKRKRQADDEGDSPPTKRRVPETVLDPSIKPQSATPKVAPSKSLKAAKLEKLAAGGAAKQKRGKVSKEEEARFKDSRGNGPRRKTEEGFAIYKEDELGISNTGGDTPLCPFDCNCCQSRMRQPVIFPVITSTQVFDIGPVLLFQTFLQWRDAVRVNAVFSGVCVFLDLYNISVSPRPLPRMFCMLTLIRLYRSLVYLSPWLCEVNVQPRSIRPDLPPPPSTELVKGLAQRRFPGTHHHLVPHYFLYLPDVIYTCANNAMIL